MRTYIDDPNEQEEPEPQSWPYNREPPSDDNGEEDLAWQWFVLAGPRAKAWRA